MVVKQGLNKRSIQQLNHASFHKTNGDYAYTSANKKASPNAFLDDEAYEHEGVTDDQLQRCQSEPFGLQNISGSLKNRVNNNDTFCSGSNRKFKNFYGQTRPETRLFKRYLNKPAFFDLECCKNDSTYDFPAVGTRRLYKLRDIHSIFLVVFCSVTISLIISVSVALVWKHVLPREVYYFKAVQNFENLSFANGAAFDEFLDKNDTYEILMPETRFLNDGYFQYSFSKPTHEDI